MINQNIKEKQIQLDKINNELDLKSQEIDKLLLSNQDKKIQLEKDAAELLIKEQSIQVAKTVNQDEENKLAEKIKNKEEILSHLESEKQKYSEEKTSLDNQNSVLKQSIETQKKLLSELQKTYKSAVKSNDLKGVFDHYSIDETTKILEDGQQIVTIKDKKGRVHQFILSKELSRSDRSYLHEIAKELSNVIDEDDCAEEYKILKKKYYRNAFPEYNFLT
jgi:chromosome segregation ATPase